MIHRRRGVIALAFVGLFAAGAAMAAFTVGPDDDPDAAATEVLATGESSAS